MKHKNSLTAPLVAVCAILCAILAVTGVLYFKDRSDRQAHESAHLTPFSNVYDAVREKYPFVTSLRQDTGDDGVYCMYYIECDIDQSNDCFDELTDIQREINAIIKARKDDEWFSGFRGHIEVISGERSLRVFYDDGSIGNEIWAENIIRDDYSILLDAFPDKEKIRLTVFLSERPDEATSEITQDYNGRKMTIIQQFAE